MNSLNYSRSVVFAFGVAMLAAPLLVLTSCSNKSSQEKATSETQQAVSENKIRPPNLYTVETASGTATVTAVDSAKRTVTLKNAAGQTHVYKCGKDVINFDQIHVGDTVKATVVEETAIFVRKPTEPNIGVASVVGLAPKGSKPGVVMADTAEITAKITAVDPVKNVVSVQGINGDIHTFNIDPTVNLSGVKAGDDVVMRYTQGLAIVVESAAGVKP